MATEKFEITLYENALPRTTFPETQAWDWDSLDDDGRKEFLLAMIRFAAAFESSDDPDVMDMEFRKCAGELVEHITRQFPTCFVWACGPVEWDGILKVFPYMVRGDTAINRYHIEGVTYATLDGYTHSWVSFEYNAESFGYLLADEEIDLEYTRLTLLAFDESKLNLFDLITRPIWEIGLDWCHRNGALAVTFERHWDRAYLLGPRVLVKSIVEELKGGEAPGEE